MEERERLKELESYQVMDSLPEKELDEIAELASAIFETPVSLITFLDDSRQWFKARVGIDVPEIPRSISFCHYAIRQPGQVMVIEDTTEDERFRNNVLVAGEPYVRFYAGSPLVSPTGHALGTLCIVDNKPRKISESQKKALAILSQRAMEYIELRKRLLNEQERAEHSLHMLEKLANVAPGALYQFERKANGDTSFPFVSKGISDLHPELDADMLKQNPSLGFKFIHQDDIMLVRKSLDESYQNLTEFNVQYRVTTSEGEILWHWVNAQPEKQKDGTVVWYGSFQDVTHIREYISTLEQVLFDISHVMRRPVATMLGLTEMITSSEELDAETLKEFARHLKTVSSELDVYTKRLNEAYSSRRHKITSEGQKVAKNPQNNWQKLLDS